MKIARVIPVLAAIYGLNTLPLHAVLADGVQAVVNDTVITYTQVKDYIGPVVETLQRQYIGQPEAYQEALNSAITNGLEQLVDRQLILHSFETEGYKLPDSVIDDVFQTRVRERFGDRVTMVKTLQAQGMTVEQFRKEVRDQYIEAAMRNQNISRVLIISPFKVQNYYQAHPSEFQVADQVKLRMITLNKNGDSGTNTLRLANEILSEIKNGASFQDMAMLYSQDAQQRQGGQRDWLDRQTLRKELSDAAFALKRGETSGVIDLPQACYLLKVEDVSLAHVKPLPDVREAIEKTLRAQEQARLQEKWIKSLRDKTFVQYY
jgi:peptidyl-prolyl cis-trans isomerase SurA